MRRFLDRFLALQFSKPTGLFGRFYMKRVLNRGNLRSNQLVLQHLKLEPNDQVLEIGFGGGWLVGEMLKRVSQGSITGLDHSPDMVADAKRQYRQHSRRAQFFQGSAENLPFPDNAFTQVVTVHTVYFWKKPRAVIDEILRVLKPGGLVVICMNSKQKLEQQPLTRFAFTLYDPPTVADLLKSTGFVDVALHSYDPDAAEDQHCLVAKKPPAG